MTPTHLTMHELALELQSGTLSSVDATQACIDQAQETERLGAWLGLDIEGALAQAEQADQRRQRDACLGPLDGVPIGLKDIFLAEGLTASCASRILEGFVAPYDGTAVQRLRDAGAIILGKLSMDEFAMGSSNEHSAFGVVRNPWHEERVPGGSSGGSAVAVAAGSAFAALGTDTGGSIRQPASLTGLVGLKPTYGRVSRYGVIAFASSLDQVGPMTRDVEDCATLLQTIAGFDPRDSTSAETPVDDYRAQLREGVKGLRLGLPREYFLDGDGIAASVRAAVDAAVQNLREQGAEIVDISLPHTQYAISTYYLICTAEASSNLARYDGVRYGNRVGGDLSLGEMMRKTRSSGFGPEVKRRIMLGTYALSSGYYDAYYGRAQKVRTLIRQDFEQALQKVDAIITPTTPTTAFPIGANIDDPVTMYLADIFTVGANLAGLPAMSLPCGFDDDGLPIGLQLLGAPWSEAQLLRTAYAYEQSQPWHRRRALGGEVTS